MPSQQQNTTSPFDFVIEEVTITADRYDFKVNLHRVISEINLYEHVDKPFITGNIFFKDNDNLFNEINWLGTEKVRIVLRTDENSSYVMTKDFRVERVNLGVKTNDNTEAFVIDIVEDHAYLSSLINVQQSYEGYHGEIIEQILNDHLNRELLYRPETGFKKVRTIVPNLTPLQAANWIKDAAPNAFGSPYYLFSTLTDNFLRLIDLETVLENTAIHGDRKYIHSLTFGPNVLSDQYDEIDESFVIQAMKTANVNDLLKLVRRGFVSGKFTFFDILNGDRWQVEHDITETFNSMIARNALSSSKGTIDPIFDEDAGIQDFMSRDLDYISNSRIYTDWNDFSSYHEGNEQSYYKQRVTQHALRHFLLKAPIDINVPGKNFLRSDRNVSIGNKINIEFRMYEEQRGEMIDYKRSGEYFVYAARHNFQSNRYTANLKCAKLGQGVGVER